MVPPGTTQVPQACYTRGDGPRTRAPREPAPAAAARQRTHPADPSAGDRDLPAPHYT